MKLNIKDKRVLITGASRGLGKSIAIDLALEGAKVMLVSRNEEDLYKTFSEIGGHNKGHYYLALDLMQDKSPKLLYENIISNFGEIDIIVHNIGGTMEVKNYLSDVEDYEKVWRFNLGIAIELNNLFLTHMVKQKWGRIIHISSSSAVMADASLPYSSAKAAVNTYVKGLASKVAKDGVAVNAVMPGPFAFEGSHWNSVKKNNPSAYEQFASEKMGVGRLGTPEDISGIVTFLCSDRASFFSGSIIPVDGGIR